MLLTKLKRLAAVVLVLAMSGLSAGLYTHQMTQAQQIESEKSGEEKSNHSPEADRATDKEQKTSMAWGKEVNGLQAGIRLESPVGEIHKGDYVTFEVFVRNASKEEVTVKYVQPTGLVCSVDKPGRLVFSSAYNGGRPIVYEKYLKPEEKWELRHVTMLTRRPTSREGINLWTPLEPGKYRVSCSDVLLKAIPPPKGDQLTTGELEIEMLPPKNEEQDKEKEGLKRQKP